MATAASLTRQQDTPVVDDDRVRLRHEEFCQPRVDPNTGLQAKTIRVESFPFYSDHPETGRSYKSHIVTRCVECGASYNRKIGA